MQGLIPRALVHRFFLRPDKGAAPRDRQSARRKTPLRGRDTAARSEPAQRRRGRAPPAPPQDRTTRCPLHATTRFAWRGARGSSMTGRNAPLARSASDDVESGRRSRLLGLMITSGFLRRAQQLPPQQVEHLRRQGRHANLDVVLRAQAADSVRDGRRSAPAPALPVRAAASASRPHRRPHLASPLVMNWSITTCAPLAKSPNCASQITSVSGSAVA